MKILFDQGTPVSLREHFMGHVVDTVCFPPHGRVYKHMLERFVM